MYISNTKSKLTKIIYKHAVTTQFPASEILFSLINQRFNLMQAIAFYKYRYQLPVYDPLIEQQNMENILSQISNENLSPHQIQSFLEELICLSRQIQQNWLIYFQSNRENDADKDLTLLRQEVAMVTRSIVAQIRHSLPELKKQNLPQLEQLIKVKIENKFLKPAEKISLLNHLITMSQGTNNV